MTTELQPVRCSGCGNTFCLEVPGPGEFLHEVLQSLAALTRCNSCVDKALGEMAAAKILAAESAKQTSWQTFCPDEFRKEIIWQMHGNNRTSHGKIMAWHYGAKGLLVMGKPGNCKTRYVWKLIQREWDAGRSIRAIGHAKFRIDASALAAADSTRFKIWVDDFCKAQILFLDDLGKGRPTPLAEECLHSILDVRMSKNLPCLFTSNYVIEPKTSYEDGLERRIMEFTEQICF